MKSFLEEGLRCTLYLFFFCILSWGTLRSQTSFNLYYLSIGAKHYKNNPKLKKELHYDNVDCAPASANIMAELFQKYGRGKGLTFHTKKNMLFSKLVLQKELTKLWEMMLRDRPVNPLVVIYYCGHGFTENLTKNQFLVSGDCASLQEKEPFEALLQKNVFVPDLEAHLSFKRLESFLVLPTLRYMLMIDCCRNIRQNDLLQRDSTMGSDIQILYDVFDTLRLKTQLLNPHMDPIVYSTGAVEDVLAASMPPIELALERSKESPLVGPLCRRTLVYVNEVARQRGGKGGVTIEAFLSSLSRKDLDPGTPTSMVAYQFGQGNNALFLFLPAP